MRRLNECIYSSDFSCVYKTLNREINRVKKKLGCCFGFLGYPEFEKAVKTAPGVRKEKQEWGYVWSTQWYLRCGFTIEGMKANGLFVTEIVVAGVTHWEPARSTLCCPIFQSPLLYYLLKGASGKWSACNCRCSTIH